MNNWRFRIFVALALAVWTLLNAYVFGRAASVPFIARHFSHGLLIALAVFLWASYPLAVMFDRAGGAEFISRPLELLGADWIGIVFLALTGLLAVDVFTGFGLFFPHFAPTLRGWALAVSGGLALIALVQGLRPPIVKEYELSLPGLPAERDGTILVVISDLHLGTLLRDRWLAARVDQAMAQEPDLVVVAGDLIDGSGQFERLMQPLVPTLRRLSAPLGVWAVTGNHEFYAGIEPSVRLFEEAGFHVLRDSWSEVRPGLVIAGVDDLTARRQFAVDGNPVERSLAGRPSGAATIFVSHTPWQADRAAAAGAGLMLSGHTHDGQIWPFGYLVGLSYPLLGGRYEVDGMSVIVCRGTGTWGPRMRLWNPCEIVRITLRAPRAVASDIGDSRRGIGHLRKGTHVPPGHGGHRIRI